MKTKIILGAIFGLLMINCIFAEDVLVSMTPEQTVNPYEIAVYDILINNQGEEDQIYKISVEGISEDWYSLSHESVDLKSGEAKTVYLFITPQPSERDLYLGKVLVGNVSSNFKLNIIKEHKITASIPDITSCICEEGQTVLIVNNMGKYSENINLFLLPQGLQVVSSDIQSFTIEPNETKEIPIRIEPLCESKEAIYPIQILLKSENSYASSLVSLNIEKKNCFDFEIEYTEEVQTCVGVEQTFQIVVINKGIKADDYEIQIEDLGFSDIISLQPGQRQQFDVTFVREDEGVYEIPFKISSIKEDKQGLVKFIVKKCYAVDLELDINDLAIRSGTGKLTKPVVKNVGTKSDTFDIQSSATWVAIKPENITLLPNESQNVFVYYSPEYGSSGEHNVQLIAKSENSEDKETVKVTITGEEIITTTTTFEENVTETNMTTTTLKENITETNMTTTTEEFPEIPEFNITKPTGMFGKIWVKIESFSLKINQKVENLGLNKMILSLIIGFAVALIILAVIYFIVMRN